MIHYSRSNDIYVLRKTKHIEKFDSVLVDIGKCYFRAIILRGIDHSKQDRDPDAVYKFGLREVDNDLFTARFDAPAAFILDLFAGQFVKVIAGIDHRRLPGRSGRRYDSSICYHVNTVPV